MAATSASNATTTLAVYQGEGIHRLVTGDTKADVGVGVGIAGKYRLEPLGAYFEAL